MFPHLPESRLWVSGQMNVIFQGNGSFPARYSGTNSFQNKSNEATGRVVTLYTGWQLTHSVEVLADAEEAEGLGLSSALGVAGFPNLDAARDPTLTASPYLARIMVHTSFPFGHDEADAGPLSTFSEMAKHRFEVRAGKFAERRVRLYGRCARLYVGRDGRISKPAMGIALGSGSDAGAE